MCLVNRRYNGVLCGVVCSKYGMDSRSSPSGWGAFQCLSLFLSFVGSVQSAVAMNDGEMCCGGCRILLFSAPSRSYIEYIH